MIKSKLNAEVFNSDKFSKAIAKNLEGRVITNQNFESINHFPLIKSKQSLYIMDWQQSKITYSKGIEDMLGHTSEEFNMHAALNFIHPDDLKIVNRIIRGIINYSVNTTLLSTKQYLTMTFRVQKKDGSYMKVLRQSSPYQMDVDGKFISNLTFLTDISFMKANDSLVEWDVFSDDMDLSKFKEKIYKEFINFFTPREMEVLYLIQNEFTNLQIASQLFISPHTVAVHRKNIFKKSNSHNAKELIEFCKLNGII